MLLPNYGLAAKDKEEAYNIAVRAWINDKDASDKFPDLKKPQHLRRVMDVKAEIEGFLNINPKRLVSGQRSCNNYYQNPRVRLPGAIKGPGTVIKYDFTHPMIARRFTPTDAANLHAHLTATFPNLKINVLDVAKKPECLVHVGL